VPPAVRGGFYSGWTGIAVAAARVSRTLQRPELADLARGLLHEKLLALDTLESFDILSGQAGAIVGGLILHEMLGDAEALGFAIRMGEALIDRAVPSARGLSWKTSGIRHVRNLTGFSHGTAGAAYALLELASVTGETRYRQAALQAFEYERRWFNRDAANWPDFRERAVPGRRGEKAYSYATAWCHGAPGIAIARLRAYELFGDEGCREEAEIALQTTRCAIEGWVSTGTGNLSLCHGLAGNAEVLLYGAQVLAADGVNWQEPAVHAGIFGNRHFATPGRAWPCGAPGGESPGLMTGLAGVGSFYIHLSGAAAPFVLAPRREAFANN
jgi:lantibiotic modifying enzyme